MTRVIEIAHEIGDTVYLVTDVEQFPRLVISYKVYKEGEIMYELIQGVTTSMHYAFEISIERNLITT